MDFDLAQMSNNHLLINDPRLLAALHDVGRGDQATITGKLVNLKATRLADASQPPVTWTSSTSRTDGGAGACEVIYVERLEVLKQANARSRMLFRISLYSVLALTVWNVAAIVVLTPLPASLHK